MQGASCSVCHVFVQPFNPDRVQVGLEVMHKRCRDLRDQEEEQKRQQQMNCHVVPVRKLRKVA